MPAPYDVESDVLFLPHKLIEGQPAPSEPTYELPPHIDECAYARALAQHVLSLDTDNPAEYQEFVRHSKRLVRVVAENFYNGRSTDKLSQDHKWEALFMHEARKPVTGISSDLYIAEKIPDKKDEKTEKVKQQIETFINLVDSKDLFIRLGELFEVSTEACDLRELMLASRIGFFAQHEETASRQMRIELSAEPKLYVHVNQRALILVLGELLHNTYKYANNRRLGAKVDAYRCVVADPASDTPTPKPMVCIHYQDFGMGAPDPTKLWTFRQRQTTESEGSGIGLYFVKRAIDAIHGHIIARNGTREEGGGLHYEIYLPVATEEQYLKRKGELMQERVEAALKNMGAKV